MAKWAALFWFSAVIVLGQADIPERARKELELHPNSSWAHFWIAESLLEQRNWQSAANELREALNGDLQPRWIEVWTHICLGEVMDVTGQRDRAVNEYRQAKRTHDDYAGAEEIADELMEHAMSLVVRQLSSDFDQIDPPEVIEKIEPEYSLEGRMAELEGTVRVHGVIGADGFARDLRVVSHLGLGLDEKAVEAVQKWKFKPGSYKGQPEAMHTDVNVEFRLGSRTSRWRLLGVAFNLPYGALRPLVIRALFPIGDRLSPEAAAVAAVYLYPRAFTTVISFVVDERGVPGRFHVDEASEPVWGKEAIAFLQVWRFSPGLRDGRAVAVPCRFEFAWSQ